MQLPAFLVLVHAEMSQQEARVFLPPITTFPDEHHHQPPSSPIILNGDNLPGYTRLPLPLNFQTPSPPPRSTSSNISSPASNPPEINSPASTIAVILGRAISDITSNSFKDALAAITTSNTPNSIHRTLSDPTSAAYQEAAATINKPPMAMGLPLPATRTYSPSPKARRRMDPESPVRGESPQSKRLKRMEDIVREIEQRCGEIMLNSDEDEDQEHKRNNDGKPSQEEAEDVTEECVGLERLRDGFKIQLHCSCGKGFEILLKNNGCFYRLT